MAVNLRNQCGHLQLLLRSHSSPGKRSAASKEKTIGATPSGQGKNMLWKQWRCGAGQRNYGSREGEEVKHEGGALKLKVLG